MDVLDTAIKIHICGNSKADRDKGISALLRATQAGNVVQSNGLWRDESEPDRVFCYWLDSKQDNTRTIRRIIKIAEAYQSFANQTAISIELSTFNRRLTLIVYKEEWRKAEELITNTINGGE